MHPGGVIVAPGALTDLVPVMNSGGKGVVITQLDLDSVEALGLVKIDLLGIRGLTVVGDVAEFVQQSKPEQYATHLSVLDSTPSVDEATSTRIEKGETIGCFQIESPGMRATLREIHARTEDDIMAKIGALDGFGKIPAILNRLQSGGWQHDQMSLFAWSDTSEEDWTLQQKVDAQQEILGTSLEAHPLELIPEKLTGAISTIDAVERVGRRVTVAGGRQTSRRSRTAKGDAMLFLTIEDLQGTLDVILFPDVYRSATSLLDANPPLLITGVMEIDGEPYLRAEKVVAVR